MSPTSASTGRWTGRTRAATITVTSTGMGCPSTAIAIEELARVGVTSFIRVGSTGGAPGGHRARRPGHQPGLVPKRRHDRCLRPEGLPRGPGPRDSPSRSSGPPAIHAPKHGLGVHAGLNVDRRRVLRRDTRVDRSRCRASGLLNVEMESSAMFVVARLRGLRAGMICAVSSNLVAGTSVYDDDGPQAPGHRLGREHRGGARRTARSTLAPLSRRWA